MRKEIEDRLVNFAGAVITLSKEILKDFISEYLVKQLLRSSSSAALNY